MWKVRMCPADFECLFYTRKTWMYPSLLMCEMDVSALTCQRLTLCKRFSCRCSLQTQCATFPSVLVTDQRWDRCFLYTLVLLWLSFSNTHWFFWARNRSTQGIIFVCLFTVEVWSVPSLSLLSTYLLYRKSCCSANPCAPLHYRSCPIPHTLLALSSLFAWSVSSSGCAIIYYSWQILRQGPLLHPISACCTHADERTVTFLCLGAYRKKSSRTEELTLCKL